MVWGRPTGIQVFWKSTALSEPFWGWQLLRNTKSHPRGLVPDPRLGIAVRSSGSQTAGLNA